MAKKIKWCLIFTLLSSVTSLAQNKALSLYDSAYLYFQQKDFAKALYYYDRHYSSTKYTDNYGTYYAALSACQVGKKDKAISYLKKSAAVGFDLSAYDHFSSNPLTHCLSKIPEWKKFISTFKRKADSANLELSKINAALNDQNSRINTTLLQDEKYWQKLSNELSPFELSQRIKTFTDFPIPKKKGFWTLYFITVADTIEVPYLLYIPKNYNSRHKTPLYTYLHGAVVNKLQFPKAADVIDGPEAEFIRGALNDNYFILYPLGKRDFGWIYQQVAFETILQQISHVKSLYNIDDNKVYIGGHSNGGSGAFWFATKKPDPFAAFFAFNFLPASYGSNTILRNLNNDLKFFGVSGKEDKTFPLSLVENIYTITLPTSSSWENFFLTGDHLLPFTKKDSMAFLFEKIGVQQRSPLSPKVVWETDDIRNGKIHWIEITELDTLTPRAYWHTDIIPSVVIEKKVNLPFNKNKTGALKAIVKGNDVYVEASCIKEFRIYLYEGMFDLNKNIRIYVNDHLHFDMLIAANNSIILNEFLKSKDRTQVVSNIITIKL
ncbi:prolyl oligopeptidase family serine peptidase [Polluticaenibacter yanchengensis]|uniref:Peptidase S9 prolyl oligopeptidase catalytic domain-containing protein n=1 Tax=Polluticaenibacter yanchengensis TaxID=3014562 RepID=A0ABT4UGB0_9BACT|nr:hypothetical protein [Chitinophagaceae bacterium LY-5]